MLFHMLVMPAAFPLVGEFVLARAQREGGLLTGLELSSKEVHVWPGQASGKRDRAAWAVGLRGVEACHVRPRRTPVHVDA